MMRSGQFRSVQTKGNKSMSVRRRHMRPWVFQLKCLPPCVDLRSWMTPVENQGQIETW